MRKPIGTGYKTLVMLKDGEDGPQGIPGLPGTDGSTLYTWVRYANDQYGNGISNDSRDKSYIGFAYNKTTPTESNTPSDYEWSKMRGDQGIPGPPGANGETLYTWIKYSNSRFGTGMSDDPEGKAYIGLAYNQKTAQESTNPADYEWAKIQGDQGIPGQPGADGKPKYIWIKYADSPTSGMSDTPEFKSYIGVAYNKDTPNESVNYSDYEWSKFIGPTGATGPTGPPGAQGPAGPILDWVQDWNNNKTTINDNQIVTPRIFAGSVDSNGNPTGVAMGKNIFGTTGKPSLINVSGLAAYHNGVKTFHLKTDGSFIAGNESRSYMSFDPVSGKFKLVADSISIGTALVTTDEEVNEKIQGAQDAINENLDAAIGKSKDDLLKYLEQVYTSTGDLTAVEDALMALIQGLGEDSSELANSLKDALEKISLLNKELGNFQKQVYAQIDFGEDGLTLGRSDSTFKTRLSNEKLAFLQDNQEVAYISNNRMNITRADISNNLRIGEGGNGGYFTWVQNTNTGNLSLKWSK